MVRIIDASVAVKWFVREAGSDRAFLLLAEVLRKPSRFAVPELFYFELASVFHRVVPQPLDTHLSLLSSVATLGIQRFSVTPSLLAELHNFVRLGLSGYDAAYVALAKLLQGKWVTCDERAHKLIADMNLSELL